LLRQYWQLLSPGYLSEKFFTMKKCFALLGSALLLLFVAASCKKGDTGPQGPEGNANVIYSDWFTPSTYKKDTLFGLWGFSHTQPAPGITQSILDSGVVITYAKLLGYNPAVWPAGHVGQMPITISYMQGGLQNDTWSARALVGSLRIRFTNDHNIYTSISNTHQFRYVIIPGGEKGGQVRPMTYEEVSQRYQIPD
jgi:hypothetical protein